MPYDPRRIKQHEDHIFNRAARTMALLVRNEAATPPSRTDDLFAAGEESTDPSLYTTVYFRGKFEETIQESYEAGGYLRSVKAVITVPTMYRGLLAQASYVDPYLDGSRFKKVGAWTVETQSYIVQNIESESLASLQEVVVQ